MEGPRAARTNEMKLVERLANSVFRCYEDNTDTMFQEFPLLYSEKNLDNVRIILEDGEVAANVNFLPWDLQIMGVRVPIACIGGVGVLERYRGKGYGTILLKDCISRMKGPGGPDILQISGDRGLYRLEGCYPSGTIYSYEIRRTCLSGNNNRNTQLEGYSEENFSELVRLYNRETVRFVRSFDDFRVMLESRLFVDTINKKKEVLFIKKGDIYTAYIIFVMEEGKARIIDFAGDKKAILDAIPGVMEKYSLDSIHGCIMPEETDIIGYCNDLGIALDGTSHFGVKRVMDFPRFMSRMLPYCYERYYKSVIDGLKFGQGDDWIVFSFGDKSCVLTGYEKQGHLIFGGGALGSEDFQCKGDYCFFHDLFKALFPIPYVNTENLNYI